MEAFRERVRMKEFTIVIVDDSRGILSIVDWILKNEGYRVQSFTRSHAALQFIASNSVDLVITDYHMPGLNGVEFARALRQDGWNGALIFMSGHVEELKANGLEALHVSRILRKPFDLVELSESVGEALREQRVRM